MPVINHTNLTDPNLHESKGVSTAAASKTYLADGLGSGSFAVPTSGNNTVGDAQIDWVNNLALGYQQLGSAILTQNTTAWLTRSSEQYFYKPVNASVFVYYGEFQITAGGTTEIEYRLKTNTKFGSTLVLTTTKGFLTGALDISDKSGWVNFEVETRSTNTNNHTFQLSQIVGYFN